MAQKININGKEYAQDELNEQARTQIMNLRMTDQKIASLEQELAMIRTARLMYARALDMQLKKDE